MIESFLRRPRGIGEVTADIIRMIGLISVPVAGAWADLTDAGILAFAFPALLLPRFLGVRAWFDILFCVTVLVAAWSNVWDLYTEVPAWDLVVHFACTAVLIVLLFLLLARFDIVDDPDREPLRLRTALVLATALGLAVGALWEMVEWLGSAYVTDEIFVTYRDTISDMAAGGLGGLAAGFLLCFVQFHRDDADGAGTLRARRPA